MSDKPPDRRNSGPPAAADVLAAALRHARLRRDSMAPQPLPPGIQTSRPPGPRSSTPPSTTPTALGTPSPTPPSPPGQRSPTPSYPGLRSPSSPGMQRASSSSPGTRISSWPASAQGRPKILFASQDEDAIPELKVALSALGHVLVASDGASVVSICEHELPSILVADTALPEWSGIDLTRHLKSFKSTARLPVVLLGGDSPALIIAAINAGARYVLPKPVDPMVLRARVQTALR